jgi:hypothetical protein
MALSVPNANGGVRDKNGEAKIIIELVKPPKRAYGLRRAAASPSTLDPRSAPGCRSPVDPRPLHLSHGMVGFARGGHHLASCKQFGHPVHDWCRGVGWEGLVRSRLHSPGSSGARAAHHGMSSVRTKARLNNPGNGPSSGEEGAAPGIEPILPEIRYDRPGSLHHYLMRSRLLIRHGLGHLPGRVFRSVEFGVDPRPQLILKHCSITSPAPRPAPDWRGSPMSAYSGQ